MTDKKTSEYGRGTTYCLGLFLAHSERDKERIKNNYSAHMWFNSASDHLYELKIPSFLPAEIKKRLKVLKEKSLSYGHGSQLPTKKDIDWAVNEAKQILYLIDLHLGIKAVEGDWK